MCRLDESAEGDGAPGLDPLLRRIFENRNVRTLDELDYSLKRLLPPQRLLGMEAATTILQEALADGRKILVIGDYDADGATASAVAVLGLRALGAKEVDYLIPNRFKHGYGLSLAIAEVALERSPHLVITVDNGISSIDGIAMLRAAGVSVIVTDHHLAGDELPAADAIVNPNQPGCDFPSKCLAGVGVMFYLLLATRARLRESGWFAGTGSADGPNLAELLDVVALGTVADMVPLDFNNRILVAQGLARIRAGRCRPGIKALIKVAGRIRRRIDADDFGFAIAPRINAAGRLENMSAGVECLLADDADDAMQHAISLNSKNRERHQIQQEMQLRALEIVEEIAGNRGEPGELGLCLFDSQWHKGVIGLVASRIKEKFNQPVVAFAPERDNSEKLSGSARSVAGLHIRDLLETISRSHPGLIEKFGGHAMAAGLTIPAAQLEVFSSEFSALVGAHFADGAPALEIHTDGELTPAEMTKKTAERVRTASPWGQSFPAPLFDGEFRVVAQKVVGQHHLKMRLAPIGSLECLNAIAFGWLETGQRPPRLNTVRVVYQLRVNEYYGKKSLEMLVKYMQPQRTQVDPAF